MARQKYDPDQSIHSMTTRQLRQYIADQAAEAQERLSTSDLSDATKAFRNAAAQISDGKKVYKSTSYMTKAEMRERAYALRDFNSLDDSSGYAKSKDWQENRKKYQTFIRNRLNDSRTPKNVKNYWAQFLTAKGNPSKKGYAAYKQYIEFLKSVSEVQSQYGYREIQKYGVQSSPDPNRRKDLANIFNKVFIQNLTQGYQGDLIDKLHLAIKDYDAKHNAEAMKKLEKKKASKTQQAGSKTQRKQTKTKTASSSSGTSIKAKTGRKMKEHGTVRRTGR